MTFTLRPTRIAGVTSPDDWTVLERGRPVGRISRRVGNPLGTPAWQWAITLPIPFPGDGVAATLDAAKAAWRAAWDALLAREGESRIERAIAAAATARARAQAFAKVHGPKPARDR